jgi:hypothetical protein
MKSALLYMMLLLLLLLLLLLCVSCWLAAFTCPNNIAVPWQQSKQSSAVETLLLPDVLRKWNCKGGQRAVQQYNPSCPG